MKLRAALVLLSACIAFGGAERKQNSHLTLSTKVQNLMKMNKKEPVLRFNGRKFHDYVKNPSRNYSMILELTALSPSHKCEVCLYAHEEFTIVANSYRFSDSYSNKLFFAMIDFDEASEVFNLLRLDMVPVFMHFPAKGKPKADDTMKANSLIFDADSIANFVNERTDIEIRIFRPQASLGAFGMLALAAFVGSTLYLTGYKGEIWFNKNVWCAIAVLFCLAMMSGQMWNHIVGTPLAGKKNDGSMVLIYGATHRQFLAESFLILFFYAMVVLGIILLIESGKQQNTQMGLYMMIAGLLLLVVFFSCVLSMAGRKAHDYPLKLLFN